MYTIYHNPRCSKSRQALQILEDKGVELKVVEYLKSPLNAPEIQELLNQMGGISITEITRKKESIIEEIGLDIENDMAVLIAMIEHPILMERPIVSNGTKAIVGRPPEKIEELF